MVVSGKDAVSVCRAVIGATDPKEAAPGTIRGDLAMDIGRNLVHGSDSPESAAREIALWFEARDFVHAKTRAWVYE
jgi:nucleoside-diphosphate kinase